MIVIGFNKQQTGLSSKAKYVLYHLNMSTKRVNKKLKDNTLNNRRVMHPLIHYLCIPFFVLDFCRIV